MPVFSINVWSTRLAGFQEMILPEACTQSFINSQDVKCRYNHLDSTGILARSNKGIGTLKLIVDSKGLKYSFIAKDTSLSNEVLEMVRNNEIFESSFSFKVAPDGERIYRDTDNTLCRVISKFAMLSDVAPVLDAAYSDSSVGVRIKQQLEANVKELEKKIDNNDKNSVSSFPTNKDNNKFTDNDFQRYVTELRMKYQYGSEEINRYKLKAAFQKDMELWLKEHPELAEKAKEKRLNKD